jgi:hypothetical protein
MRSLDFGRYALGSCIAAAMLASCDGSQPGMSAVVPQGATPQSRAHQSSKSNQDLLYVSNSKLNDVEVFDFPQGGRKVQTLSNINEPGRLCSDANGDVFVTSYNPGKIIEFAHGAKNPTTTIVLPYPDFADACAADPTSANLAVIDGGETEIYQNVSGSPTTILPPTDSVFWFLGYDADGNLFLDGETGRYGAMWEVPKGTTHLLGIDFPESDQDYIGGQVQWDGQYITVQGDDVISRIAVSFGGPDGSSTGTGSIVGSTSFEGCRGAQWQSWIQGSTLVVPCSPNVKDRQEYSVNVWSYPGGGKPIKKIISGSHFGGPYQGVTVSIAP